MRYDDENWIKIFTRDTPGWLAMSWQARGLALEIARKLPRTTGELSLGRRGLEALAPLLRAEWSTIEPFVRELIAEGRLVYDEERQTLTDPQHVERQASVSSGAVRTRNYRARQAAEPSHDASRPSDVQLRAVTPCDAEKRDVTRGDYKKQKKDKKEEIDREAAQSTAPPRSGPGSARGSRLPADWSPGDSLRVWAKGEGLDATGPELAKFRDHWLAKAGRDATKADWDATYRNWLRRAREFGVPKSVRPADITRQPVTDDLLARWTGES